ncbi:MAG: hypothetical protein AAF245_13260, partial [Pseudomonadota bacterium]
MTQPYAIPEHLMGALNMRASDAGPQICWPAEANIYHMTLGKHLAPDRRDRTAMIYEDPTGAIHRQSFA